MKKTRFKDLKDKLPSKGETPSFTLRMDVNIQEEIVILASIKGVTQSVLVRDAIIIHLDKNRKALNEMKKELGL